MAPLEHVLEDVDRSRADQKAPGDRGPKAQSDSVGGEQGRCACFKDSSSLGENGWRIVGAMQADT
jgi:hypothetical protein